MYKDSGVSVRTHRQEEQPGLLKNRCQDLETIRGRTKRPAPLTTSRATWPSSVLLSAHLLHSPLLADLLPLSSVHVPEDEMTIHRSCFTCPAHKTSGNQLVSGPQSQIPRRQNLSESSMNQQFTSYI